MRIAHLFSMAAAVALAVGISAPASAAGTSGSPVHQAQHVAPVLVPGKTILISGDADSAALNSGFNNIDSGESITCKRTCSITATMMVQFIGTTTGIEYAVCLVVDGTYYTCPYGGETINTFFLVDTTEGMALSLAAGTHTVQTQAYASTTGLEYANYDIRYDLVK